MSTRHIILTAISAALAVVQVQGVESRKIYKQNTIPTASARLSAIQDAYFNDLQRLSPEFATYVGKTRAYNALWSQHTEEEYEAQNKVIMGYLAQLRKINPAQLSSVDAINYNLLLKQCQESIEGYMYGMHVMPLDHLGGIPLDVEMVLQTMPLNDRQDYDNMIARLKGIPLLIDQTIALMNKGLERDITPPQIVLRNLPESVIKMIPDDIQSSIFFRAFKAFPEALTSTDQHRYANTAEAVIRDTIYPAYLKLHDYLVNTYIPNCRQTIGASDLPNGAAWYNYCVRRQTTTKLSPQEIHEIGLGEVKRIRQEMEKIVQESGFDGNVADYLAHLNKAPEFFYQDGESLLNGYREITHYIDGELHRLFGRQPKLPYEVVPMPSHIEEGQIGAYYMRGSIATGRPGRFYVNTYDIGRRPKWQMESLALHEAVPGHHFQISIAQEIEGLPEFRKYTGYTAYIEGWGLYSEGLGYELGLYLTPSSQVGRLVEEVWRAVRLVVDTGMHALGWSREQAINYFVAQTGMGEREATTEVDRYIVWPGQALAYKIGELSIKRWRQEAKEALGARFDVRAFHDVLLEQGALPLDVCEQQMRAWQASY